MGGKEGKVNCSECSECRWGEEEMMRGEWVCKEDV